MSAWGSRAAALGASHVYEIDEASGATLLDSVNGSDGTSVGAVRLASSTNGGGGGMSFDGVDDRSSLGALSAWSTGYISSGSFTIEALIRTNATGGGYGMSALDNATPQGLEFMTLNSGAAGQTGFGWRSSNTNTFRRIEINAAIYDNAWHHVVYRVTYTDATESVRIDKVTQTPVTATGSPGNAYGAWEFPPHIACRNNRGSFDNFGQIDVAALALYPSLLSDADADALYDDLFVTMLPAPTNLRAGVVTADQVELLHDPVEGASGYEYERDGVIL